MPDWVKGINWELQYVNVKVNEDAPGVLFRARSDYECNQGVN